MKEFMEKLNALVEQYSKDETSTDKENFEVATVAELGAEVEFDGVGSEPTLVESGEVAPDGAHILEDGRTLVVEGGLVTEVIAPEAGQEEESEAPAEEAQALESDEEDITAIKAELDKMKEDLAKLKAEKDKLAKEKSELAEKLKKAPATKPVTKKTETKKVEKVDMSKLSNYERIAMKNGLPVV